MDRETLIQNLESVEQASPWLRGIGLRDTTKSHCNLTNLADAGVPLDLLAFLCQQLEEQLPALSDPDMTLNNLERFISAARSPLSLVSLFQREPDALRTLLQILSTSQYLSDLLVRDPESLDLLRMTEGQPVARQVLIDEVCAEAAVLEDERLFISLLRRYKQRETLRIAYGDIVRRQSIEVVTRQISYLADAICEAAIRFARRRLTQRRGDAMVAGKPARFCALALGKLGGEELNYSSDIDLIFLCDGGAKTAGPRAQTGEEFFSRLAKDVVKLLTESTEAGAGYRVDLRLRPHGAQGPIVCTYQSAIRYYDTIARTWERQAFVKARPAAGDLSLGEQLLAHLESWIYRRYLNRSDISGIKALKRKIERRAEEGPQGRDIKVGHGGIRDIEFVIQFLQLLNGGDLPAVRTGNTLEAIRQLEQAGCLTMQERTILEENYAFLRKLEHRLQILFDLQTHALPANDQEMARLAVRMGFPNDARGAGLEQFKQDMTRRRELNRKILDHLLHDAFVDDEEADPITELILDPEPQEETIRELLSGFGFKDHAEAYHHLMRLGEERIPFLSTRRCRHFLASIAPRLLAALKTTPDPHGALVHLEQVSDSLGGKGVLWELFSFSPATLNLYVRLCAASDYLTTILTTQPGMIDELMDSLVLDRLPPKPVLAQQLDELCHRAEDINPILSSFRNLQHLRVGVRDVLGTNEVHESHGALADVAEVILQRVAHLEMQPLIAKHGTPMLVDESRPCEFLILALGKLGGREPNYHSDLDLVFLYESNGQTAPASRSQQQTNNQHFFSQLGQKIIKRMTFGGVGGQLYELDPRLRPNGAGGALAVSLPEFHRYFTEGAGQLWERQALCKARIVFGSDRGEVRAMHAVRVAQFARPWQPSFAKEIYEMRLRLEETASKRNLKRGPGGTMDIEFIVQRLQLEHGRKYPELMIPNTLQAIDALQSHQCLGNDDAELLASSYRLLRKVESRLRLLNTVKRHDLPTDPLELKKLAYLLDLGDAAQLEAKCAEVTAEVRRTFLSPRFAG